MSEVPPNINLLDVPEFEKALSPEALAVYRQTLPGIVFQVLVCDCGAEQIAPPTPIGGAFPPARWVGHEDHEYRIHARFVRFMAVSFGVSMLATLAGPNPYGRALQHPVKTMAEAFNRGVAEGWLKYGVLLPAKVLVHSVVDLNLRYTLLLAVGSDLTEAALNSRFGRNWFFREGTGPIEPVSDAAMAAHTEMTLKHKP